MITETLQATRTQSGLSEYTGSWGLAEVRHLLRRTMFGAAQADITYFSQKTMSQAVDELLSVSSTAPSPPVNNYNNGRVTDPDISFGDTWVNGPDNAALYGARTNSLKAWWAGLMINQDRSILEKLTLFWHNHFSTEITVYRDPIYGYNHLAMLRANAMGNFKSLVKSVTLDPAMLNYLNGQRNTKNAPDENYARELQELFTLGKGPDSQYTEEDVRQAAKVLTGWRINRTNYTSYFLPNQHDSGDKTFSSFYGDQVINGQAGADGANELDSLLDMIFAEEEVAKYVCRRLYRWFVYYDIDSGVETDVIEPLAQIFRNANYNIKPVLEALFKSEHFFDVANRGCVIKSPIDYIMGLIRQTDIVLPDSSKLEEQYYFWQIAYQVCAGQQQNLLDPPNVSGWPAYYQIPQFHEIWVNTDTLPNRNQISDILIIAEVKYKNETMKIDAIRVAELFDNPGSPTALINDWVNYFYTLDVSSDQKEYMKSLLLSGQTKDSYWTDAWDAYQADPTNQVKRDTVRLRLMSLLKYVLNLAEHQLS
ncbi:MAG: DUF1800 domain-containing protein [Flavobacteriales bacterium]|nr:DUF1800 domain-containing protein [Bacteroidota bacterium]MCB9240090.1 DUF1800 domain-containing protein [Flavobacteriales bacterium]